MFTPVEGLFWIAKRNFCEPNLKRSESIVKMICVGVSHGGDEHTGNTPIRSSVTALRDINGPARRGNNPGLPAISTKEFFALVLEANPGRRCTRKQFETTFTGRITRERTSAATNSKGHLPALDSGLENSSHRDTAEAVTRPHLPPENAPRGGR